MASKMDLVTKKKDNAEDAAGVAFNVRECFSSKMEQCLRNRSGMIQASAVRVSSSSKCQSSLLRTGNEIKKKKWQIHTRTPHTLKISWNLHLHDLQKMIVKAGRTKTGKERELVEYDGPAWRPQIKQCLDER